ncbi:MAG: hypothetical protein VYA05_04840, partial [Pseudomonadota bacterium]|nr:hypothetical protein [Pseudomonadota bacterium]MEC9300142.1 hypothetical protein [Pseudomonadota bacterium]
YRVPTLIASLKSSVSFFSFLMLMTPWHLLTLEWLPFLNRPMTRVIAVKIVGAKGCAVQQARETT